MIEYPRSAACEQAPETIFRESKRLLALINSYLDVLRLDAGARPIRLERVQLNEIARDVLDLLAPLATAARISLQYKNEAPVLMHGDHSLIAGAILNIVSNAIKYGKAGSVVTLTCARNEDAVAIRVHNEGQPIDSAQIPRLFDPYYRSPKTEAEKPGTGLGLAFVKRIAERHGGTVRVESDISGTTFEINLPAEQGVIAKGAA
jgi:signal transduction histidine kinase